MIKRIFLAIITLFFIGPIFLVLLIPNTLEINIYLLTFLDILITIIIVFLSKIIEEYTLKKEAKKQLKIEQYKNELEAKRQLEIEKYKNELK